jgi:hypothetical protein
MYLVSVPIGSLLGYYSDNILIYITIVELMDPKNIWTNQKFYSELYYCYTHLFMLNLLTTHLLCYRQIVTNILLARLALKGYYSRFTIYILSD